MILRAHCFLLTNRKKGLWKEWIFFFFVLRLVFYDGCCSRFFSLTTNLFFDTGDGYDRR